MQSSTGIKSLEVFVDDVQELEITEPCVSGCASTLNATFTYDNDDYPSGPHIVTVLASDDAGNTMSEHVTVNAAPQAVAPECPVVDSKVYMETGVESDSQDAVNVLDDGAPGSVDGSVPDVEADEPVNGLAPQIHEMDGNSINQQGFELEDTLSGGGVSDDIEGALSVGQSVCIEPVQTTDDALPPIIENGVAVFANSAENTDTAVRATVGGASIVHAFKGEEAPSSLSWQIELPAGYVLEELPNGSIAIVDPDGLDLEGDTEHVFPSDEQIMSGLDDVRTQIGWNDALTSYANDQVSGDVLTVFAAPLVSLDGGDTAQGLLVKSSFNVITATLPTGAVEEAQAMVIAAVDGSDDLAYCAEAFKSRAELFAKGCLELPTDSEEEPTEEDIPGELPDIFDSELDDDPEFMAEVRAADAQASAGIKYPDDVTEADKKWCKKSIHNTAVCYVVFKQKLNAVDTEDLLFLQDGSDDTIANAFRHGIWSAYSTIALGPKTRQDGRSFLTNHEMGQLKSKKRRHRFRGQMDIRNNAVGYKVGRRIPSYDNNQQFRARMKQACEKIFRKALVNPIKLPWSTSPRRWAKRNNYKSNRLIYRTKFFKGKRVTITGRTCDHVW